MPWHGQNKTKQKKALEGITAPKESPGGAEEVVSPSIEEHIDVHLSHSFFFFFFIIFTFFPSLFLVSLSLSLSLSFFLPQKRKGKGKEKKKGKEERKKGEIINEYESLFLFLMNQPQRKFCCL